MYNNTCDTDIHLANDKYTLQIYKENESKQNVELYEYISKSYR